jgi:hypothetical protein
MDTRDEIINNRPIAANGGVVDGIQHGIDDNPDNDAEKGATLGGIGGAAVGLAAGAAMGPVGAVAGAIIGGAAGALMSGAAVAAVDAVDNDNKVSGIGRGVHIDNNETPYANSVDTNYVSSDPVLRTTPVYGDRNIVGNGVPGIQTGGRDLDGGPDTRGMLEKTEDFLTGDNVDDKRGEPVKADTRSIGEKAADAVTGDRR